MGHQVFCSCFLILILVTSINGQTDDWLSTVNAFLKICVQRSNNSNNSFLNVLKQCVQNRALTVIDKVISKNSIPVIDGVSFLRFADADVGDTDNSSDMNESIGRDRGKTWRESIFDRFSRIFKTHVIKINIEQLTNLNNTTDDLTRENYDGRRRHNRRKNQMMPMLMMGILVMGSVLIPMGFQFLAVLGGKALILAKLALMLSSIQGLKKVATSGVNYGLYHGGPPGPDGWHDRSHHELPLPPSPPPPSSSSFNFDIPFQPYQSQAYSNF
ncbi:hypothetical protein HCN44_010990 [Aphidius gifuensis]|uniref:Odorant-binding protein n=1 Tax=Aphidius gifuensis TaxID=684658 RepID=A0A835CWJ6_APHGI|nr:hypothetical protein HCN44_010990 [Aphidius gifuensis]